MCEHPGGGPDGECLDCTIKHRILDPELGVLGTLRIARQMHEEGAVESDDLYAAIDAVLGVFGFLRLTGEHEET